MKNHLLEANGNSLLSALYLIFAYKFTFNLMDSVSPQNYPGIKAGNSLYLYLPQKQKGSFFKREGI